MILSTNCRYVYKKIGRIPANIHDAFHVEQAISTYGMDGAMQQLVLGRTTRPVTTGFKILSFNFPIYKTLQLLKEDFRWVLWPELFDIGSYDEDFKRAVFLASNRNKGLDYALHIYRDLHQKFLDSLDGTTNSAIPDIPNKKNNRGSSWLKTRHLYVATD